MNNELLDALKSSGIIHVDTSLMPDLLKMLSSRAKHLHLDWFELFSVFSVESKNLHTFIHELSLSPDKQEIHEFSEKSIEFFIYFCAIIKFLYPMMEQLETMIDDKIKIFEIGK